MFMCKALEILPVCTQDVSTVKCPFLRKEKDSRYFIPRCEFSKRQPKADVHVQLIQCTKAYTEHRKKKNTMQNVHGGTP